MGIEYNPDMVELSKRNAAKEGVSDKAQFIKADLFESDFSQATVITMFLLPDINLKLRPKILDSQTRHADCLELFYHGRLEPGRELSTISGDCTTWCTALLWIVPAKVAGHWQLADGELTLTQTFQQVTGTVKTSSNVSVIKNGKLNGDEISFNAGETDYTGRISGDTVTGVSKSGAKWRATRTRP